MFDEAAINILISNMVSHAKSLGIFRSVNFHEPKAQPGSGLRCGIWVDAIQPLAQASSLESTSGYVVAQGRIYGNALQKPEDDVDPQMMKAAVTLIGAYSGDFDFGATVRNVDLLGMYGRSLMAQAGYATIANTTYRIMDISVPVVINDLWPQVGS